MWHDPQEIRCQFIILAQEIRCQFIIFARKDQRNRISPVFPRL